MLFSPMMLVAAGTTVGMAILDKTMDGYGHQWIGATLKILLPIIAFGACIYFIETNALLRWLL